MNFREEYPRMQFKRDKWINLNGEWQFDFDFGSSAEEKGFYKNGVELSKKINLPFCPESQLSGIGYTDRIDAVCYKKEIDVSFDSTKENVVLHFGAVDYRCSVYVNETKVGTHKGGYVSFDFDITSALSEGKNTITVFAYDDSRNSLIPSGKQSDKFYSYGCFYTRTTGIWQTVWLEFVPKNHIDSVKFYPNIADCSIGISASLCGTDNLEIEVEYEGKKVGCKKTENCSGEVYLSVELSEKHLWEIGNGRLYDVKFKFGEDLVESYFGLREVRIEGNKFLLNNKSVFQRLVLDQGFYPDGIYTAPSDAELLGDIKRSLACGFNGARLHEKIFEERFLYYCDKMGYIVWGEYPDWGLDFSLKESVYPVLDEWTCEVKRDFNHPAIIGWCPHNETWDTDGRKQFDEGIALVYKVTKQLDPTRPCIDTSGNFHVLTDIFDIHDYNQDPPSFKAFYDKVKTPDYVDRYEVRQHYDGKKPFFISEYGGIGWTEDKSGWGYGNVPESKQDFINRFKGLASAILDNPNIMGLCYTQLTDVEQEQNGLYTYDRKPKFDTEIFKEILSRKAAIED